MAKFRNKKNWERFLCEIDGMPEREIREIMGDEYIDTPGNYKLEKKDYDGILDYMKSNMGESEFDCLYQWWIKNVKIS